MSKGRNVSDFMPHVVKLVGAPSLEVRKMVYIYLARYANHDTQCREMALLSINAFQRGLADREPLLRSLALRVLTCMDVPDVLQLQILGVRTCCKDSSPYVRKCAANAVGKLHPRCLEVGDESQAEQLVDIITTLLEEDGSTMVLTSAMIAFCEICPQRLDLLHGCYRKVCHLLTDMDEWGQVVVIDALMRYCRTYFKQPRGQLKGSAERIDQERRVTRSTRKEIVDGTIVVDNEETDSNHESKMNGNTTDSLLAMTTLGSTANNDTENPPPALPPRPKQQKVKRRVVRKAFYSDEEDESEEEDAGSFYPNIGGNIAAAMRDHSTDASPNPSPLAFLSGGNKKSFGFRDDANAQNNGGEGGVLSAALDLDDEEDSDLDEDHRLLLQSSLPLLRSRNSAVVLAVCSLHYYCGVASIKTRAALGKALVRIHRDRREIQYIVLVSIRTLVQECPSAFTPFLNDFFVKGMDPSFTRMIKLDILVSLCIDPSAIDAVLSELRSYVRHHDKSFACAAVSAVGKVAELARIVYDRRAFTGDIDAGTARDESNSIALGCLSGLVTLSEFSKNDKVGGECISTIQRLLAQLWSNDGGLGSGGGDGNVMTIKDPAHIQERVLKRLLLVFIRSISEQDEEPDEEETKTNRLENRAVAVPPSATASLLWTIGEWLTMSVQTLTWNMDSASKSKIRVEVLRLLAKAFSRLDAQIKLQALHLASKVFLANTSDGSSCAEENSLSEFILAMGRADVMQDVRDRARYESNVLHLSVGLNGDTSILQQRPSSNCMSVEKARKMLLDRKPTATSLPLDGKEFGSAKNEIDIFKFGSLSSIVGLKAGGSSLPLPDWASANSSSSLRDPEVRRQQKAAEDEADLYEDSSSDSSSSDDETSSSDSESSSSSDSSSDNSSDSDSEEEEEITVSVIAESNDVTTKPIPASTPVSNGLLPLSPMINNEVDDSSSSSSSSSDSSSDSDSDISDNLNGEPAVQNQPVVEGTLFDLPADTINTTQASKPQYVKGTSTGSSVASGLEGLVMSPLVVNKNDANEPSNIGDDCGLWKPLVRPELSGGLSVKMRFVFGQSRAKEVATLGLDPSNPSTVCVQVQIENMRTDVGSLRHVRIVHRRGASGGSISPSKVILPPEISVLKKGQASIVFIGITFETATDRDGVALAKFDVKSDRGSTSIEIRPSIGEMLDTPPKNIDFDAATSGFEGNKFLMISSSFSLSPINDEKFKSVPTKILKQLYLRQIGEWPDKGCFVGKLPESGDHVFIRIQCDKATGSGTITVCGNNAMASNSIANLVKSSLRD